jgi:hypothetical protein
MVADKKVWEYMQQTAVGRPYIGSPIIDTL